MTATIGATRRFMIEPPSLLRYFRAWKEMETIGQADDRHLRLGLEEADARTDESGLVLLEELRVVQAFRPASRQT